MIRSVLPLLALLASPAAAGERSFSVTGFDRIRVEGPYRVELVTGVAPFARASGSPAALDGVSIGVQGRTLVVRPNPSSWGGYPGEQRGPVQIRVGTHELGTAWINGPGTLAINRVSGLSFDIAIQGSGSAEIGQAQIDQMKLGISGAGSVRIAGTAGKLIAVVRGASLLDAAALSAKDVTLGAEGPSDVRLTATAEAEVDARGTASVQLFGGPACTVRAQGSATVSGCRVASAGR
jgi:hypothetical protein